MGTLNGIVKINDVVLFCLGPKLTSRLHFVKPYIYLQSLLPSGRELLSGSSMICSVVSIPESITNAE